MYTPIPVALCTQTVNDTSSLFTLSHVFFLSANQTYCIQPQKLPTDCLLHQSQIPEVRPLSFFNWVNTFVLLAHSLVRGHLCSGNFQVRADVPDVTSDWKLSHFLIFPLVCYYCFFFIYSKLITKNMLKCTHAQYTNFSEAVKYDTCKQSKTEKKSSVFFSCSALSMFASLSAFFVGICFLCQVLTFPSSVISLILSAFLFLCFYPCDICWLFSWPSHSSLSNIVLHSQGPISPNLQHASCDL